ncbi:MAG TPA: YHS domain-containing protein, partial [Beijerinckiaceae bacterium]|nr:YHS domain-containing protein [Beijerinckiaceae bacterium]
MTDHAHHQDEAVLAGVERVTDPVCGMMVDPTKTKHRAEHDGRPYFFCSARCREKFVADPKVYLTSHAEQRAKPAALDAVYTCPMHPQIRQAGPGACPICGMALEPETPTAISGPNPELADMTRRFWIGLVLAVPVVAL